MGMEHFVIVGDTVIDEFKISNSRTDHDCLKSINAFFNTLTAEERKLIDVIDEYSLEAAREAEAEAELEGDDFDDEEDFEREEMYECCEPQSTLSEEQLAVVNKYNAYFEIDTE
ncbi:hypothetical protein VCHA53O466_40435 [Vibrio chagasii]|nr:hypothetical protein VCHA53O466_40435 [Vibrio chagasii]